MTPDEKRKNIEYVYNLLIDNLTDVLNTAKRWPESATKSPKNQHTLATVDELIGHLQTRREKQKAKVK